MYSCPGANIIVKHSTKYLFGLYNMSGPQVTSPHPLANRKYITYKKVTLDRVDKVGKSHDLEFALI